MSSARVFPASLAARAPVASGLRRGDRRARGVARARPPTAPRVYASICGIDLGTTNSCVAVVIDGRPVLVPDEKGRRTIPSVVHFAADGSVTVGHAAAKRLTRDPQNTFHSVKRFIGKRFKDKKVAEDARRVPYEVCATVEADAGAPQPGITRALALLDHGGRGRRGGDRALPRVVGRGRAQAGERKLPRSPVDREGVVGPGAAEGIAALVADVDLECDVTAAAGEGGDQGVAEALVGRGHGIA